MDSVAVYFLFAVAHPITELLGSTKLKTFLNRDYYRTARADFPVSSVAGIGGSLVVLAVLVGAGVAAVRGWPLAWCLALGLAVADVIQHAVHCAARPRSKAPWVHLLTILGVAIPLYFFTRGFRFSETWCLVLLVIGALLIFGNWARNSLRVRKSRAA